MVSKAGARGTEGSQPMIEGKCHLLQLVRHRRLLIGPPFSPRAPGPCAHLSLQLLQTLLHTRRHLQTEEERGRRRRRKSRSPLVMQNISVAAMAARYEK